MAQHSHHTLIIIYRDPGITFIVTVQVRNWQWPVIAIVERFENLACRPPLHQNQPVETLRVDQMMHCIRKIIFDIARCPHFAGIEDKQINVLLPCPLRRTEPPRRCAGNLMRHDPQGWSPFLLGRNYLGKYLFFIMVHDGIST